MGKSFKGFSKALSLILAVAMVVTCVPTSAYAAELLADESEDILISNDTVVEESSDALVNDASASEEKSSSLIDTQKEADLAAAPEENTAGEEDIIPDKSKDDVSYGVVHAVTDHSSIFTVAGENATEWKGGTYTTVTVDPTTVSSVAGMDSVNGVELYVAPKKGYEITDANLADAIKVVGAYKENNAETTEEIAIPESAYTIAKTTKAYVDNGSGYFDFTRAYVVTIKGNTEWLNAYKKAAKNGAPTADKAGYTKFLRVVVDDSKVTARKVKTSVVGEDNEIDDPYVTFGATNTTAYDISAAFTAANWAKKSVSVAFKKAGAEDVEFKLETGADTTNMKTAGKGLFYYVDGNHKVYFSVDAIAELFDDDSDYAGYTLTITCADKTVDEAIYVVSEEDSLVTFKGIKEEPTATNAVEENIDTTITSDVSTSSTGYEGLWYPFLAEVTGTKASTGRTITAIKYSVDGGTAVAAKKLDITKQAGQDNIIYNEATGGAYSSQATTADGGYWVIPASDMVKGKTITLIAETTEAVTVDLSRTEGNLSYVSYTDNASATVAIDADISVGVTSTIATGKDYEFTVVAKTGRYISEVTAKMTQPGGSGGGNVPVIAEDGGKYKIENVTGKLTVYVLSEAVDPSKTWIVSDDAGAATITDIATGDEIDKSSNKTAKAYTGKSFTFKVVPDADKIISKVEYTMGSHDKAELTKDATRSTIDGTSYYTITGVDGDISLTVTQADAARITKFTSKDATITINGVELKDGKTALAKAGEPLIFGVAAQNGAEIEGVYFKSAATGASGIDKVATAGEELIATNGTYKIGKDLIVKNTANDIFLTVVTSREADAGYTVDFTSHQRPDANSNPVNKFTSLALKGGGIHSNVNDGESSVQVTANVKDAEGNSVTTGTHAWALLDTDASKAVASFDNSSVINPYVDSTDLPGENVVTYKQIVGFPNGYRYEGSFPVTVTPMSTLYSDLKFELTATVGGSIHAINTASLQGSKMIRVDDSTLVDDSMKYEIKTTLLKFDGEEELGTIGSTGSLAIGGTENIKSVAWTVTPSYEPTLIVKPYAVTSTTGPTTTIKDATKEQVLTVTATITYADDSTAVVSDTLTVVDETYGYVAVPYVTQAGVTAPGSTAHLETKAGGVTSTQITWKVFEIKAAPSNDDWYKTVAGIEAEVEAGKVEEVPAADVTWADAIVTGNKDSEFATISGKDQVSVTAKKAHYDIYVAPSATVDGVPVMKAAAVEVDIHNELDLFNVAVTTKDQAQISLATDYTKGLGYPKMTSALAALKPISWVATSASITTDNEIYEGFELTAIPEGTILALPSQEAFDGTTIDKKKVLAGWSVRIDDNNSSNDYTPDGVIDTHDSDAVYYKADGTETVTINSIAQINAIWAYRYESATNAKDGKVALYKVVGDADPAAVGASLTIAQGKEIETGIGYYAIDLSKAPTAAGAVYDETELVYGEAAGGTLTLTDDPDRGTVTVTGNKIKGGTIGSGESIAVKWVDANGAEYSTYDVGGLKKATDGLIAPTITASTEAAAVYSVEVAEFEGLEVGQTKTVGITVKNTNTSEEITRRNQFASVEWTVSPEDAVKVDWVVADATATDSLKSGFTITGLKKGPATLTFKAVDANGAEATLAQPLSVTVEEGSTIDVKITNAVTGAAGETVAADAEMGVLVEATDNVMSLALVEKDGTKPATSNTNWKVVASNPASVTDGEDVEAWATATITVDTDKTATLTTPSNLGLKKLTVTYTTDSTPATKTWYTREIDVRSYYAVAVMGPKDATEAAAYEVDNGTTAIEMGKEVYVRVPYVDGSKDPADKFTASLEGFSAKQIGTVTTKLEHKGWVYGASGIVTTGTPAVEVNGSKSLTDSDWASVATNGIVPVSAIFGLESAKLSGLPTEIVLSDETLTKSDKSVNGKDRKYVQIGVTPKDSTSVVSIEATDAGKVVMKEGADYYPVVTTTNGYDKDKETTASTIWDGTSVSLTPAVGSAARTDSFTIAKINDPANNSRNYVGTTTLTVKVDGKEYATIPVYINGEFENAAGKLAYMERGVVLESGARTVNGEIHYYKDSVIVENGIVDVDGKKILIVANAQVTTVGDVMYNGEHYYVGADGFLKTGGKFTGEGTGDKNATYYADENGVLAMNKFVELDGVLYFFSADDPAGHMLIGTGDKFTTLTVTEDGNWKGTFDYVVGTDGKVLTNNTIKVGEVTWYVNSYGQKVTYEAATEERGTDTEGKKYGKYTDPVTKQKWVIYENGNAQMDDILYAPTVTWTTEWPKEYVKGNSYPTMKYKVNYTSKNQGKTIESEEFTATVTCNPEPIPTDASNVTFTATADLSAYWTTVDMKEKATATKENKGINEKKYTFRNGGSTSSSGGIEIVGLEEEYKFAGTAIKPAISVVDNDLGITLAEGTDYKISYKDNTKIGTATITVNGKGNYTGKNVTAQFKIVSATEGIEGLATKVNKVEKIAFNPSYTGEPQAPETVTVVADGESIVYEWNGSEFQKKTDTTKEVGITIVNNVNAGTATVAAVGADGKAKKANFKINKVDLSAVSAEQLAVEVEEEAAYLVKGAQPGVSVTYTPEGGSAIELINGQDFKVEYKYANKKNAGEGNTIKIKGNGANFTKAKEVTDKPFKIVKHDLQDEDIVCVEAYTGIKPKKVKVVVKDSAGVVVPAKQYEVHVFTDEGLEITTDKNAKLEAGKEYTIQVKASASGNLEGEASAKVTAQANIGKAKATLSASLKKDGVAYTGEPIDLENYQSGELIINYFESGIKLTLKGVGDLTYGEDFEVAGYVNNVNKGTMTVYVRGISDKCSGTLGIKVKISAKTMKKAE